MQASCGINASLAHIRPTSQECDKTAATYCYLAALVLTYFRRKESCVELLTAKIIVSKFIIFFASDSICLLSVNHNSTFLTF